MSYQVPITEGGSVWEAARAIKNTAGLSQEQFARAWTHSTVLGENGEQIPIHKLALVHPGATVTWDADHGLFQVKGEDMGWTESGYLQEPAAPTPEVPVAEATTVPTPETPAAIEKLKAAGFTQDAATGKWNPPVHPAPETVPMHPSAGHGPASEAPGSEPFGVDVTPEYKQALIENAIIEKNTADFFGAKSYLEKIEDIPLKTLKEARHPLARWLQSGETTYSPRPLLNPHRPWTWHDGSPDISGEQKLFDYIEERLKESGSSVEAMKEKSIKDVLHSIAKEKLISDAREGKFITEQITLRGM